VKVLFVHNNFPAQFVHLAPALKTRGHEVAALGSQTARPIASIPLSKYAIKRGTTPGIVPLAVRYEADCLRGAAAARLVDAVKQRGFVLDLVIGHNGWGGTLFSTMCGRA